MRIDLEEGREYSVLYIKLHINDYEDDSYVDNDDEMIYHQIFCTDRDEPYDYSAGIYYVWNKPGQEDYGDEAFLKLY